MITHLFDLGIKLALVNPPELDAFDDADALQRNTQERVLTAASQLTPLSNLKHTLRLSNVAYEGPERYSLAEQKKAILQGRTLSRRLKGSWELVDNETGDVLDSKQTTVARVPYFTQLGTTISNGSKYSIGNQLRLMPGVFSRIKDNGELESHVNALPGQGRAHRYYLDPEKGIFNVTVGQAKIPLMPLARALGATDEQLLEAWGQKLYLANMEKDRPADLDKLYERLVSKREAEADGARKRELLREAADQLRLDPRIIKKTLGVDADRLNLDVVLAATKKLAALAEGKAEIDDRDHLAFQSVHGPADLLAERLTKDYDGLRRRLLWQASMAGNVQGIPPGALTKQINSVFHRSGLAAALEEINPIEILDKMTRVTRMGEGGIPSTDSIPSEARSVQPSHLSFIDPVRSPESNKIGVDVYFASAARRGKDHRLYAPFTDARTGQTVYRSPQDVADLVVTFPGSMERPTKRVLAMRDGKADYVLKDEIDLIVPEFEQAFSPTANLVPMKAAAAAQRMAMGSRFLSQALPLVRAEAPLVQNLMPGESGKSFEEHYGKQMGAMRAKQGGQVVSVSADGIKLRYQDGTQDEVELYNHWPLNRKTFLHNTPLVKPGDTFEPGQLLARSNFTDESGSTAIGSNLLVGYAPWKGYNYEDAVVISESGAHKLSSEHAYQHQLDKASDMKTSLKDWRSLFPGRYEKKILETIDDDGVIKEGSLVHFDEPLVLAAVPRQLSAHKVHRKGQPSYEDRTITWRHHAPGLVTDVVKGEKGTAVVVKSVDRMQVGDKLAGRYGDKGVVAAIVPDEQMPLNPDGEPLEVLLNDLGITSRGNPAQVFEAVLGTLARRQGKPYKLPDFTGEDLAAFVEQEARRAGVDPYAGVTDQMSGRKIPNVLTGARYLMKLSHQAEDKGQGRGISGGYTQEGAPSKGDDKGRSSKRMALMHTNALLAHSAYRVLGGGHLIRGQRNDDWWLNYMQGNDPPRPNVPPIYQKFVAELQASGINVVPDGGQVHIMAMTDKDIDKLAGDREITKSDTVRLDKNLEPVRGGLFDPELTGGNNGNRWSFVRLHEPMPSPVMEDPIRHVLGLTQKQFKDVIAGKEALQNENGPQAIVKALQNVNVPLEIAKARMQIESGRKTARDQAIRKLRYLKAAQRLDIHPSEWVLNKVPVLPPKMRPISAMQDSGTPLINDANYLYADLIEANNNLRDLASQVDDVGEERLAVYNAFKAVTGLGDPVHPKLKEKQVSGLLKNIFGSSPKHGSFQQKLLSTPVNLVGRAVITPDPDLDMDHVGLPETRAWDLYEPFIIRNLVRRGLPMREAARHAKEKTAYARQEMVNEMDRRPVIIDRAPVLHKFGVMAFWPKLTKGNTMRISPLVTAGFGADFDGDMMNYSIPVEDEEVKEAVERMMPSRNLISPADFETPMFKPSQEYVAGLYKAWQAPRKERKSGRHFRSEREALQAYLRNELSYDDLVSVG